nr:hypothetical protein [Tanacetum cinerariifolium]
ILEALGGNSCIFDSIWEKQDKIATLLEGTQRRSRFGFQTVEMTSTFLMTPSEHSRDDVNNFSDAVKVTDSEEARKRFTG